MPAMTGFTILFGFMLAKSTISQPTMSKEERYEFIMKRLRAMHRQYLLALIVYFPFFVSIFFDTVHEMTEETMWQTVVLLVLALLISAIGFIPPVSMSFGWYQSVVYTFIVRLKKEKYLIKRFFFIFK